MISLGSWLEVQGSSRLKTRPRTVAEIYLDGELVVFEGNPPATLEELLALLHAAAGSRRGVVSDVICDGVTCTDADADRDLSILSRIDVHTVPVRVALRAVATECRSSCERSLQLLGEVDRKVLRTAWTEAREDCVHLAQGLGSTLQQIAVLDGPDETAGHHEPLQESATGVADALGRWIESVAAGDATRVCLRGEMVLARKLRAFAEVIAQIERGLG